MGQPQLLCGEEMLILVANKLNTSITELYEYCLKENIADKNLIAKWKKQGYENLCCLRCIQIRDTNFATNCICRVPKSKLEEVCTCAVTRETWKVVHSVNAHFKTLAFDLPIHFLSIDIGQDCGVYTLRVSWLFRMKSQAKYIYMALHRMQELKQWLV